MRKITYVFLFLIALKARAMDVYCNGAPTTIQTNGGGNVAITAIIDPAVYVGPNASVCEYATVLGNTQINDQARVYGYAKVNDGSIVSDNAQIFGNASITSTSSTQGVNISGNSLVYGNAKIAESATIKANVKVFENARVSGNATIDETALIFGTATVTGSAQIKGSSKIHGNASIGQNIISTGVTDICLNKQYPSNTTLTNVINCPTTTVLLATSIATGSAHSCVMFNNGKMRCWGSNSFGQLGNGDNLTIGDDELPKFSKLLLSDVTQMALGGGHTCALLNTGKVRCWGRNTSGELGYGNNSPLQSPGGDINLGGTATQIAAGLNHTCAILSTGVVRCWGLGDAGQLGYGNTGSLSSPGGDINLGVAAIQITAGTAHTCALLATGVVRCWGLGTSGQLGYGNANSLSTPGALLDVGGTVTQITAGSTHTCALLNTGKIRCWGFGVSGQLGYGNTDSLSSPGGNINLGGLATQVWAGDGYTCALLTSGAIRCWGLNFLGQLGYGNTNNLLAPGADVNLGGIATQLSVGNSHLCALLDTREVRCWGLGTSGQLGYGNANNIGDNELPFTVGDIVTRFTGKNKLRGSKK